MERNSMTASEAHNIEVVRKYVDGCNAGDLDLLLSTLAPDVSHYFLPAIFPPIKGAELLARFWIRHKLALNPVWSIDHIIARDNEVVQEYSSIWTPPGSRRRLMNRGAEWCVMRDGRIAEIRSYFMVNPNSHSELNAFPYRDRGYFLIDP
jgi:ketosteroid isomerase-like protein